MTDRRLAAPSAPTADDEIDWDEDEAKASTESAAAAIAAGGQGRVSNPVAVPNQKLDEDPAKTSDLTVVAPENGTQAGGSDAAAATTEAVAMEEAKPEAAPKPDFSRGIEQTDAEKEAEKRAARAKRFGLPVETEEQKKLERAKKFGADAAVDVKGLDEALPERRAKRGRKQGDQAGREAKRQTPDRRADAAAAMSSGPKAPAAKAAPAKAAPPAAKKAAGKITDDPAEKAKAEARAKRFASS